MEKNLPKFVDLITETDFFMKDFQPLPLASELEHKIFKSYETKNQSIYESQYVRLSETKIRALLPPISPP